MDGVVSAGWAALERDWDSPDAHRRFISLCATHNALDQAGRLYRAVRDADPARSEEAKRRLSAVVLAAVEQLSLTRTPPHRKQSRTMWLMVGACGFVVLYAFLTLLRVRSQ